MRASVCASFEHAPSLNAPGSSGQPGDPKLRVGLSLPSTDRVVVEAVHPNRNQHRDGIDQHNQSRSVIPVRAPARVRGHRGKPPRAMPGTPGGRRVSDTWERGLPQIGSVRDRRAVVALGSTRARTLPLSCRRSSERMTAARAFRRPVPGVRVRLTARPNSPETSASS